MIIVGHEEAIVKWCPHFLPTPPPFTAKLSFNVMNLSLLATMLSAEDDVELSTGAFSNQHEAEEDLELKSV